jgi:predicted metalloprotease with PDZ domain
VKPSIILPDGWTFGTALAGPVQTGDRVDFNQASLTTLVDSPLDAGQYERRIVLLQDQAHSNEIDAFADDPAELLISDDDVRNYKNLVAEADALYGARHWHHYHFLLTLSDAIPFNGIEHHESSDNRARADYWSNPDELADNPDLLPHEFSHSWNGKYRRPADLWQPDYQLPERTDLLWVYEGLNQYLGDLLAFRSGFLSAPEFPDFIAYEYAREDIAPGRLADPLVDTAIAAPYLYTAPADWRSERRTSDDFYNEGELVWLSADAIIRTQSHGSKSLDDFLRAFYGGRDPGPGSVVTYTRQDVVDALGAVQPYDWNGFFQRWVYDVAPHPAPYGIDLTGWKLVWTTTPNRRDELAASEDDTESFAYSLGFDVKSEGTIADVLDGSPSARAGIGANVTLVAVDGEKYSASVLRDAIDRAKTSAAPIELLVQSGSRYQTYDVDYHGGNRYPHLERVPNAPDLLAQIAAPHRAAAPR